MWSNKKIENNNKVNLVMKNNYKEYGSYQTWQVIS